MKYYDVMDKEEKGIYISFESQWEAEQWLSKRTKENYEYVNREGMHIVENNRLTTAEMISKAFAIANNAIYFNDNSDYLSALYGVCKRLRPYDDENEIGSKYIDY